MCVRMHEFAKSLFFNIYQRCILIYLNLYICMHILVTNNMYPYDMYIKSVNAFIQIYEYKTFFL